MSEANTTRVDRELKRMMGELPDPGPQPPQVITSAEVESARELELARRRERDEREFLDGQLRREQDEREFLERKLAEYTAVKAEEKACK